MHHTQRVNPLYIHKIHLKHYKKVIKFIDPKEGNRYLCLEFRTGGVIFAMGSSFCILYHVTV